MKSVQEIEKEELPEESVNNEIELSTQEIESEELPEESINNDFGEEIGSLMEGRA